MVKRWQRAELPQAAAAPATGLLPLQDRALQHHTRACFHCRIARCSKFSVASFRPSALALTVPRPWSVYTTAQCCNAAYRYPHHNCHTQQSLRRSSLGYSAKEPQLAIERESFLFCPSPSIAWIAQSTQSLWSQACFPLQV
jgi:hypothetical protein